MSIVYSIAKTGVGIAAEYGASVITAQAVAKYIPETANKATKICCIVGGAGMGGYVGAKVREHYYDMFDSFAEMVKELKKGKESEEEEVKIEVVK